MMKRWILCGCLLVGVLLLFHSFGCLWVVLVGFYLFNFPFFSVSFVLLVYLGVSYAVNGTFNYLKKKKLVLTWH